MTSLSRSWHSWHELRQRLLHDVWWDFEQSLIDDAVDQWPTHLRACVRAIGGHFGHTLWLSVFSVCLMNFMFHTTLDAVKVHYKSMKCDVSFPQGSVRTLFRWGEHVFHVCINILPAYSSAKITKIKQVFAELWSQTYCHVFFMKHSVLAELLVTTAIHHVEQFIAIKLHCNTAC